MPASMVPNGPSDPVHSALYPAASLYPAPTLFSTALTTHTAEMTPGQITHLADMTPGGRTAATMEGASR